MFVGNREGTLFALDAAAGAFIWDWTSDAEGIWGSPIVANGTLYVGDVRAGLHALEPANGSHQWTSRTEGKWLVSTPVVDPNDGTAYVSTMSALGLPDGHDEFFFDYIGRPARSSRVRVGRVRPVHTTGGRGNCGGGRGASGDGHWQTSFPDFVVSLPTIAEDRVFVGCWDHSLFCLDATDGTERWTHATAGPNSGYPNIVGGQVFITSGRGNLNNGDVASGARNWFVPINGPVTSAPSITDEAIYVATNDSGALAVDRESGRELWQHKITDQTTHEAASPSSPAVASSFPVTPGTRNGWNPPERCLFSDNRFRV